MTFFLRFWTLVVSALCWPLHLSKALGWYDAYKRVFPFCVNRITVGYNKKMHDKKRELFRGLSEFNKHGGPLTVLEIGCGSGANFEFYPPGCKVICTDPNPHFQKYLDRSVAKNDHVTCERFVVASGEDLRPVEDASVDVVVATLVLCSVCSVTQTLREARRVLRPVSVHHHRGTRISDDMTAHHVLMCCLFFFTSLYS